MKRRLQTAAMDLGDVLEADHACRTPLQLGVRTAPPSGDCLRSKNLRRRCKQATTCPGPMGGPCVSPGVAWLCLVAFGATFPADPRSEEHTSELQSRQY